MARSFPVVPVVAAVLFVAMVQAAAQGQAPVPSFTLTIRDHAFAPAEIEVPANARIKLVVKNADATPEEFESTALHREKIIPGGQELSLPIEPLKPGRYEFFGDFHRQTAHGALIVR